MSAQPSALGTLGFRAAGLVNVLGVLLFSRGFTNEALVAQDPVVFSRFGLVCIVLWGFAYLAVARSYPHVPLLVAVFAAEKLLYTLTWVAWLSRAGAEWGRLYAESPLAAVFYAIYGPTDLAFGVFFAWIAFTSARVRGRPAA